MNISWAGPVNDAYRYDDSFADNTGIDLTSTGFVNLGGSQTAKSKNNELISGCFGLPGPAGSVFTGWSFAEFTIDDLTQVNTSLLHIESCSGTVNYSTTNPQVGTSVVNLATVVPATALQIRFRWVLKYQGNGGSRTASISHWRALGTTTGATTLQITPSATFVNSNSDVTFSIGIGSNSVATKNPLLTVDLNLINGNPGTGVAGMGLATDATVCYDLNSDNIAGIPYSECQRYRPIEFLSASDGTSGEPASTAGLSTPAKNPAAGGPTDGIIVWSLNDLPDGYAGSISVNLHVPKGYVDGKALALQASLGFGENSSVGGLHNNQTVTAQSATVTVTSQHAGIVRSWSPYGNVGPGAGNIYDNYYVRNSVNQNTNPSDLENIQMVVQANSASTCVPEFRTSYTTTRYNWPTSIDTPAVGAPLDNNPVTATFFRASYVDDSSNARLIVRYDVPAACANGTRVRTEATVNSSAPAFSGNRMATHNVVFEACRRGYNHMHRVQSELSVGNNYNLWPGWPEYYINKGSLRTGEFFSTWAPYGDSSYRTHTIVLDKTYAVIDVPASVTFHGYRTRSREDADSKIYFFKDPSGSAPNPTDTAFNNSFDPATQVPAAGWFPVQRTWSAPFTSYTGTVSDDINPSAVAGPGSRIMVVKTNDNTSSGASDYGLLRPQAIWRVCDGGYGCATPAAGSPVQVTGNMFTYQQTQTPHVRACSAISGYRAYVGTDSYPKVYAFAAQHNVQAGGVASIVLNPHNGNLASQYVDGRWSFDLSSIASNIDLNNVTGEVLTNGMNLPAANQNVIGQACSATDIVFVAPTMSNPVAYWDVPPRCQIPNGWGYRIGNITSQDNYVQSYQLKLNVPVNTATLAGTVLDFPAQIRTTDLSAVGADNAVATNRWSASNYESIASVTVLENPSVAATKTAPAGWPVNSTFTYALSIENQGNTPLIGYYMSDQLPRTGVNGSEFDPDYGAVFISKSVADIMLESSVDTQCDSAPTLATWATESLVASSRPGYLSQSSILNPATRCVRLRRSVSGPALAVAEVINMAIDVGIPDDVFLSGKNLYNKALVGVSDAFGGTSNVNSTETALVTTTVDGAVVLGAEKSTTASLDHPGQVGWRLGYRNASGTVAYAVTVSDTLPAALVYNGLMHSLPAGVSCTNGTAGDINSDGITDCAVTGVNPDGTGGTLELTISELGPDDGNPSGGPDQGHVGIWTIVSGDASVQNCVVSIPASGVGGTACMSGVLSQASIVKSQQVANNRAGIVPAVYFGETIEYSLLISNAGNASRYVSLEDHLPAQTSYVAGSLTVNGASASDSLISNGRLSYLSTLALAPAAQTEISYRLLLNGGAVGGLVSNDAVIMLCADRISVDSCNGSRSSNEVQTEIRGQRLLGTVFNDNGSGAAVAHDGQQSGLEIGVPGVPVSLVHSSSGALLASATTDGTGVFALYAGLSAAEQYTLRVQHSGHWIAVSHNEGTIMANSAQPAAKSLNFTNASVNASYESIRFGLVKQPVLRKNEQRMVIPAQSVLIPHSYTVTTSGLLQFDVSTAQAATNLDGWQVSLFEDADCNQELSTTEILINGSVAVDPDVNGMLCVIFSLHTPNQLSADLDLQIPLTAQLVLSDDAATGHGLIHRSIVVDTLGIRLGEVGRLVISKRVVNLTQGGAAVTSNAGLPGEVLRYTIDYEVLGSSPVEDVNIHDSTPAYTQLLTPLSCPSSVVACIVVQPDVSQNIGGYSGPLQWKVANTLEAGSAGSVSFDVQIE